MEMIINNRKNMLFPSVSDFCIEFIRDVLRNMLQILT